MTINQQKATSLLDHNLMFRPSWDKCSDDFALIAHLLKESRSVPEAANILDELNADIKNKDGYFFDGTFSSLIFLTEEKGFDVGLIQNEILRKALQSCIENKNENKVNENVASRQALQCIAVYITLLIKKRKIHAGLLENQFMQLSDADYPKSDDDIEKGRLSDVSVKRLRALKMLWGICYPSEPYRMKKNKNLEQFAKSQTMASLFSDSEINLFFQKIQPYIDEIAKKYFPSVDKKHPVLLAIRYATTIVFMYAPENIPKGEKRHSTLRLKGFVNKWLEYAFDESNQLKEWVITFFKKEMEKRICFIKRLSDINSKEEIISYLPVFESFRFLSDKDIDDLLSLTAIFRNREEISNQEKDEIAKRIVFNFQKIAVEKQNIPSKNLIKIENQMMVLFREIFKPKMKKLVPVNQSKDKSKTDDDIEQGALIALFKSMLAYNEQKNDSFIGYIGAILSLNTKSEIRSSTSEQEITKISLEEPISGFLGAARKDFGEEIDAKNAYKKVLNELPEKEKDAISLYLSSQSDLTEAQKRAKNRGIERIKDKYSSIEDILK